MVHQRRCSLCKCELLNIDGEEIAAEVEESEPIKCLPTPVLPSKSKVCGA